MQVASPGGKILQLCNTFIFLNFSCATCRYADMQVAPPDGKICKLAIYFYFSNSLVQRAESKWLEEDGGCLIRRAFYTSIEQSTIIRLATEKYTFENTRFR